MNFITSLFAITTCTTQVALAALGQQTPVKNDITIYVGDSRTVGLKNATDNISEDDFYIAKVGEGYKWLVSTAEPEVEKILEANQDKNINIVYNFGVNDLCNVDKYAEFVNNLDENKPENVNYYYVSINPVKSYPTVNNEQISSFNSRLSDELNDDITWIDTYTQMQLNGFTAPDGLHYSKDTYVDIYNTIVNYISEKS